MSRFLPASRCLALLMAVSLLAGCDSSSSSPTAPTTLVATASIDEDLYAKVNAARASNDLAPLSMDGVLSRIAEDHSWHMRTEGGLTHQDAQGGTIADRLGSEGVSFSRVAENIGVAFGHPDPAGYLHSEFMSSGPHRKIILDPSFTRIGIGVVTDGSETWVTEIFVRP